MRAGTSQRLKKSLGYIRAGDKAGGVARAAAKAEAASARGARDPRKAKGKP
jgi:hypothetical protein